MNQLWILFTLFSIDWFFSSLSLALSAHNLSSNKLKSKWKWKKAQIRCWNQGKKHRIQFNFLDDGETTQTKTNNLCKQAVSDDTWNFFSNSSFYQKWVENFCSTNSISIDKFEWVRMEMKAIFDESSKWFNIGIWFLTLAGAQFSESKGQWSTCSTFVLIGSAWCSFGASFMLFTV